MSDSANIEQLSDSLYTEYKTLQKNNKWLQRMQMGIPCVMIGPVLLVYFLEKAAYYVLPQQTYAELIPKNSPQITLATTTGLAILIYSLLHASNQEIKKQIKNLEKQITENDRTKKS